MNLRAALLRNTLWYALVTFIGLAAGLLMSVILARGLGPDRMGDYSYLLWALRTMTAVATLGWALATVRYTAEASARGDADAAWGWVRLFMRKQLVTTLVVVAVLVPVVVLTVRGDMRWAFLVAVLCLIPMTMEGVYTHAVYGAQRYDVTAQTSTVKMTIQLLASALAVTIGGDIPGLTVGLLVSCVCSCLLQRQRALEIYAGSSGAPPAVMTADVRGYVVPLAVVAVLETIVWDRSELFFLGLYTTSAEIAFYSLAFGLATKVMVVPEIAVGALLPTFSALHGSGSSEELARMYRTALRYVALVGAPIATVLAAVAPALIVRLYGEVYLPAAHLLGVLAVVGVLSALRKVAWAALRALGDRRCALTATWVAAALNIALAAVLIPRHGTWGAVIANTAAQLLATVWVFAGMARTHRAGFPALELAKIGAVACVAGAVAWAVSQGGHDFGRLAMATTAGFVAYVGTAVATGILGPREWTLLTTSTRRILAARATGA